MLRSVLTKSLIIPCVRIQLQKTINTTSRFEKGVGVTSKEKFADIRHQLKMAPSSPKVRSQLKQCFA